MLKIGKKDQTTVNTFKKSHYNGKQNDCFHTTHYANKFAIFEETYLTYNFLLLCIILMMQ